MPQKPTNRRCDARTPICTRRQIEWRERAIWRQRSRLVRTRIDRFECVTSAHKLWLPSPSLWADSAWTITLDPHSMPEAACDGTAEGRARTLSPNWPGRTTAAQNDETPHPAATQARLFSVLWQVVEGMTRKYHFSAAAVGFTTISRAGGRTRRLPWGRERTAERRHNSANHRQTPTTAIRGSSLRPLPSRTPPRVSH